MHFCPSFLTAQFEDFTDADPVDHLGWPGPLCDRTFVNFDARKDSLCPHFVLGLASRRHGRVREFRHQAAPGVSTFFCRGSSKKGKVFKDRASLSYFLVLEPSVGGLLGQNVEDIITKPSQKITVLGALSVECRLKLEVWWLRTKWIAWEGSGTHWDRYSFVLGTRNGHFGLDLGGGCTGPC